MKQTIEKQYKELCKRAKYWDIFWVNYKVVGNNTIFCFQAQYKGNCVFIDIDDDDVEMKLIDDKLVFIDYREGIEGVSHEVDSILFIDKPKDLDDFDCIHERFWGKIV